MSRFSRMLALACYFVSAGVGADQVPARGMLLVATDEVHGPHFAQTVILLLQHDERGTVGLVVNRPIEAAAIKAMPEFEDLAAYTGTIYWGGPLSQSTARALLRTDTPPKDAVRIFGTVHMVTMDEASLAGTANSSNIRIMLGYAGWAPEQLQYELAFDSWHVLPATEEIVFATDASEIWRKVDSSRQYQAAADLSESRGRGLLVSQ